VGEFAGSESQPENRGRKGLWAWGEMCGGVGLGGKGFGIRISEIGGGQGLGGGNVSGRLKRRHVMGSGWGAREGNNGSEEKDDVCVEGCQILRKEGCLQIQGSGRVLGGRTGGRGGWGGDTNAGGMGKKGRQQVTHRGGGGEQNQGGIQFGSIKEGKKDGLRPPGQQKP